MNTVFVLQHAYEDSQQIEDVKFIGVYSTREKAAAAVSALVVQPGFARYPEGFHIAEYTLDRNHWTEGFITEWD